MIAALISALQGITPILYLVWGLPGAFLLAWLWTRYQLDTLIAEIYIRGRQVAVRTIWETARDRKPLIWRPILDLRSTGDEFIVTIGHTPFKLSQGHWPDTDKLLDALRNARDAEDYTD